MFRTLLLNVNSLSTKLVSNGLIQIKPKLNFYRNFCLALNSNKIVFNKCVNQRDLLPLNSVNDLILKRYLNLKTGQKARLKTDNKATIESSSLSLKSKKRLLRKKPIADKNEKHLPVLAFSTADEYNMEELAEGLKNQGLYESLPFTDEVEDVLHLSAKYQINQNRREIFIFSEGSIVCWNMPFVECEAILKFLKPFQNNSYDEMIVDEEQEQMHFEFVNSKAKLQRGLICLNANNKETLDTDLEKYAFSNAIAQSVKLSIWESNLDRYIDSIEFVSQDIKEGGKIKLSRDQVFRKTGELFDLKHNINLSSDLLDIPDFYWDRHELEKIFSDTIYFLNIRKRTNIMNEKINHCIELMELLSSHLNDKHNTLLEWMIIILIMVEVVFEFIHYAERLL